MFTSKILKNYKAVTALSTVALSSLYSNKSYNDSNAVINKSDNEILLKIRPDSNTYTRIDSWMEKKEFAHFVKDHAVHDTLDGSSKIESYEIYKHNNSDEIFVIIKFGSALNGHREIVHGGTIKL